jgi:NADPH-dependent ferric siderophore reductase
MSEHLPVGTRRPVPDHMYNGRLKGSYLLDLEVVGVDELAPHVRLITMSSSDLRGFEYTPGQDLLFELPEGDRTLAVATPSDGRIPRKAQPTSRSRSTRAAAPPPAGRPR